MDYTEGLYKQSSKLIVSPSITPMMLPYISPFKEFRLNLI